MIEFGFKPNPVWLVGGAVLVVAWLFWSYAQARRRIRGAPRLILILLRLAVVALITLCWLNPQRVKKIRHQEIRRLAVCLDTSRSMRVRDAGGSRLAWARDWIRKELLPQLPANLQVTYFHFDRVVLPLTSLDQASPTGGITSLAAPLETVLAAPDARRFAAALLISDGVDNAASHPEAVAREFRRRNLPLDTLTVGTTNRLPDVDLENIRATRLDRRQPTARVTVTLAASGYAGRKVPVRIFEGQRMVGQKEVTLTEGTQVVRVEYHPVARGKFELFAAEVPVLPRERLADNNRIDFGLEIVEPRIRVLYMEASPPAGRGPECLFLKHALEEDPEIKVTGLFRDQYRAQGHPPLSPWYIDPKNGDPIYDVENPVHGYPRTLAGLLYYDVIINSDIVKEAFSQQQLEDTARFVEDFGGGFIMIGGMTAFGAGNYDETVIDRIVPVEMIHETTFGNGPRQLRIPPAAWRHPIMQVGATPAETKAAWTTRFPGFLGHNRVDRAKPGAVVLAQAANESNANGLMVLIAVQEIGKGRSMAFTPDTTYLWGQNFESLWGKPIHPNQPLSPRNCDNRYYRQFWDNAIRWLAASRIRRKHKPVALSLPQSRCFTNESVNLTVAVEKPDHQPDPSASVVVRISRNRTNVFQRQLGFDRVRRLYHGSIQLTQPGRCLVTAVARRGSDLIGSDRQLLVCRDSDRELADVRARPGRMARLARLAGGTAGDLGHSDDLVAAVKRASLPPVVEYRRSALWDKPTWLATIVLLLAAEWILRRRRGLS